MINCLQANAVSLEVWFSVCRVFYDCGLSGEFEHLATHICDSFNSNSNIYDDAQVKLWKPKFLNALAAHQTSNIISYYYFTKLHYHSLIHSFSLSLIYLFIVSICLY
jgi:hypothetical protein